MGKEEFASAMLCKAQWMEYMSKFVEHDFTGEIKDIPITEVPEKPSFILLTYDEDSTEYFLKVFSNEKELKWFVVECKNRTMKILEVIVCEGKRVLKTKITEVDFLY